MKKLLFTIVLGISITKGFSQTSPTLPIIDSKEYEDLKASGKLDQGLIFPTGVPSAIPNVQMLHNGNYDLSRPSIPGYNLGDMQKRGGTVHPYRMPMPGANPCSCLQTIDATYSVVPSTAGVAPDYRNDDGSTAAIALPFTFCIYGANYNSVYINNNGNLTFTGPWGSFTSSAFPTAGVVMVAPFWADVDTRNLASGLVYYKISPTNLIVQWQNVGYYSMMVDKINTFQVIITNGADAILPPGNNVGFCYGDMQWTTGAASGGTAGFGGSAANVGINDGTSFVQIGRFDQPGSAYDGGFGQPDGVDWLDGQSMYFNGCSSTNIPPIITGAANCDTVKVCGIGDTVLLNLQFLSPEAGQITTVTYNLGGVSGFSCLSNIPGNTANATFQFVGSLVNYGFNTITITATDNGIPVGVSTISVVIWVDSASATLPVPVISGGTSFCVGDSLLLNVAPTTYDAYLWSTGSNTTTTWAHNAGIYFCTAWWNGCQASTSINITTNPLPTPLISGNTITSCGTGTTTLSSDSLIYSSYSWAPGGATTSSINVGAGNYILTVTDANGCTDASAPVNVVALPMPDIQALADTSFCIGGTANLSVVFTGPTIPATCQLSTTGGCPGSSTAAVGTGITTNFGTGYPAPFGNWYTSAVEQFLYTAAELNAAGITGGKIDQLDWNVASILGISTYHNFTVKMGCTNITQLTLGVYETGLFTVYPANTYNVVTGWNGIPFSTSFEWDGVSNIIVEICFSEFLSPCSSNYTQNCQTYYTATGYSASQWWLSDCNDQCASPTGFGGTAFEHPNMQLHWCSLAQNPSDYSYQWVPFPSSTANIANDTAQITTATPTLPTTFQVSVVNVNGGCTAVDTVVVNTIDLANMYISPAGPYCLASPLDTLTLNAAPLGIGAFSGPGITDTYYGVFNPVVAGLGTWTIHYTVSGSICGTADTTIQVTVQNTLDATITYVGQVCNSWSPFQCIAATPGGFWHGPGITDTINGTFDPSPASVLGLNTISYTIYSPCYSVDTAVIEVIQQKFAAIDSVPPICIDAPAITMTSIGVGGMWSGTGITNSVAGTFNPSVAGAGPHVITHYFSQLCGDTATTTIIVVPLAIITATPDVTSGCEPLTVNFTSTTDQPGGTCFWNFGDGNTSTTCNPTETYVSFNGGIPYNVVFTYTNLTGCVSTISQNALITVFSQPEAIFSATPQPTDITNPTIQFLDHSTGVINNWIWSFGTGAGSTIQNPIYTYADTGHYAVTLIVMNNNGCTDTATNIIIIDPILTCYIPSAFSPDGNGDNDVFMLSGTNILRTDFDMTIFDRWGEVMFHTGDLNEGWNGCKHNHGTVLEQSVYVYKIKLRDWKGLGHEYIGHVNLIH